MPLLRALCFVLLLVSAASAAPPSSVDGPLAPSAGGGVVVGPGSVIDHPDIPPTVELLSAEVETLRDELKKLRATVSALSADLDDRKTDFDKQKDATAALAVAVEAVNQKVEKHTHPYTFETVTYWNREFVTSGRPIVKQEKRDFGSFIQGLPQATGMTAPPVFNK